MPARRAILRWRCARLFTFTPAPCGFALAAPFAAARCRCAATSASDFARARCRYIVMMPYFADCWFHYRRCLCWCLLFRCWLFYAMMPFSPFLFHFFIFIFRCFLFCLLLFIASIFAAAHDAAFAFRRYFLMMPLMIFSCTYASHAFSSSLFFRACFLFLFNIDACFLFLFLAAIFLWFLRYFIFFDAFLLIFFSLFMPCYFLSFSFADCRRHYAAIAADAMLMIFRFRFHSADMLYFRHSLIASCRHYISPRFAFDAFAAIIFFFAISFFDAAFSIFLLFIFDYFHWHFRLILPLYLLSILRFRDAMLPCFWFFLLPFSPALLSMLFAFRFSIFRRHFRRRFFAIISIISDIFFFSDAAFLYYRRY